MEYRTSMRKIYYYLISLVKLKFIKLNSSKILIRPFIFYNIPLYLCYAISNCCIRSLKINNLSNRLANAPSFILSFSLNSRLIICNSSILVCKSAPCLSNCGTLRIL